MAWPVIALQLIVIAAIAVAMRELPVVGAGGLLHPARHRADRPAPDLCEDGDRCRRRGKGPRALTLKGCVTTAWGPYAVEVWQDIERWIDDVLRTRSG